MEAPQPKTDPPPERRFEPRRRENAEEIIHWLRVLGGRFQGGALDRPRRRSGARHHSTTYAQTALAIRTDMTPGYQGEGLVRDHRVEVRVLFGA